MNTNNLEQVWKPKPGQPIKVIRPLTRKQEAFVQELVQNPRQSVTQAVKNTYNTSSDNSASQIATENLRKPNILNELAKHSATSEFTLLEVMEYSKRYGSEGGKEGASYAGVAMQTANSILDRLHGKATTKIEQTTQAVTLNIDLTGSVTDIDK